MISIEQIGELQKSQYRHDMRNHADIWSLHKTDRLKHYGLHFAKYVGRLARGASEPKPVAQTLTDAFLVTLSAANTLHQDLTQSEIDLTAAYGNELDLLDFADAAGRFADACEKIDHMEEFVPQARQANLDIASWLLKESASRQLDLVESTRERRKELSKRHFYISD